MFVLWTKVALALEGINWYLDEYPIYLPYTEHLPNMYEHISEIAPDFVSPGGFVYKRTVVGDSTCGRHWVLGLTKLNSVNYENNHLEWKDRKLILDK